MGGKLRDHWPLWTALTALWVVIAILLLIALHDDQGHFVYAIDDAYIHMAIAKNVVRHHVWGVSPYSFSWCSSSPLWTSVLAVAYQITGVHECTLLLLTILSGTGLCIVAYELLRRRGLSPSRNLVALGLVLLLTPVPSLIFTGQEHLLHLLLTILVIFISADDLSLGDQHRRYWTLLALAPLLCTARYEGLFLVGIISGLYLLRGRRSSALLLFSIGAAPVLAAGILARLHGWYFLPTSLMIKGNTLDSLSLQAIGQFMGRVLKNFSDSPSVAFLLIISIVGLYYAAKSGRSLWTWENIVLVEFSAMTSVHVLLARTGMISLSRYDGYLIGAGVIVFAGCWDAGWNQQIIQTIKHYRLGTITIAIAAITMLPRALTATLNVPLATHNIYEQQYQMGRFVQRYYNGQRIGINDIGAVDFLADVKLFDYGGLATMEVAKAMRIRGLDTKLIGQMSDAAGLDLAIVYDDYLFGNDAPPVQWIPVARWRIADARVVNPAVTFYATSPNGADRLLSNLAAFERELPSSAVLETVSAAAHPYRRAFKG